MRFKDRSDAGKVLAQMLARYDREDNSLILALPRGGVPVAYEVAIRLHCPLDVFIVRKLGFPKQPELAMGAISSGGIVVMNESLIRSKAISPETIAQVVKVESQELERRERAYRADKPAQTISGKTIFLIDDGLATGASMKAALLAIKQQNPAQLIIAVPVATEQSCDELQHEADLVICAKTPEPFYSVGSWYDDFSQTTDFEVQDLLQKAAVIDLS
ncbi:phosphoribosyltransferase [Spirosoma endbachense]|uniref:Phosphoribosyltransferase n=1 Tax=Spirosoma endbachense TaxID=2666025 RepID=A0A6P1W766_9BACT|nr:phosphoribosyltransferase [Spirosoma endbachense]QHW00213.1 phosphoribosyltransferase [Spirosoma endbachense]